MVSKYSNNMHLKVFYANVHYANVQATVVRQAAKSLSCWSRV